MTQTTESERAKRQPGYAKKPHDLITAAECVKLIDYRVSVLIAHWESERRAAAWPRRLWRALTRAS